MPGCLQLAHGPDRRLVVAAEDRVGQLPARPGQDLTHASWPLMAANRPSKDPVDGRPRVLGYRLFERAAAFGASGASAGPAM